MTADEYLKLAQLANKQGDQATELKALKDWESNGGKSQRYRYGTRQKALNDSERE